MDSVNFLLDNQLVAPLVIFLSVCVAFRSIKEQKNIAKKRATLDLIIKSESEDHFKDGYETYAEVNSGNLWMKLLEPHRDDETQTLKNKLDEFLNHYELVALSIDQGILDEDTYKRWMKSSFVSHYKQAKEYIEGVRSDPNKKKPNKKAYIEFERLALKWEGNNNHTKK